MAKELYLYSGIYDFTAEDIISSMEENKSENILIRVNSPGGSVFSGWGIIAKMGEHEGEVNVKIDGIAASMAAILVVFADSVEMLDVARIMIHRADMYVSSPEQQAFLNSVNRDLKAKLLSKVNPERFREVTGFSIDEVFDPEKRIDVWLTAKQSKEIGLVTKIVKVKPEEAKAVNDAIYKVAAQLNDPKQSTKITDNKMTTVDELKAQHPALYALVVADGVSKERDRVGAWLAFAKVDIEAVTTGIKEGKDLSQTAMAEFTVKSLSAQNLEKIKSDNPTSVKTTEVVPTETAKAEKSKAFDAEMKSLLNLK